MEEYEKSRKKYFPKFDDANESDFGEIHSISGSSLNFLNFLETQKWISSD